MKKLHKTFCPLVKIVTAVMMLYKNAKTMVCSIDGHTDFFYITAGVLKWDTLVPYQFIICFDYVLWTSANIVKGNGFIFKKEKKQTVTSRNYDRCKLYGWSSASCKCPMSVT